MERARTWRPAPFEQVDGQGGARRRTEQQAQGARRGGVTRSGWTKEKSQCVTAADREFESPHLGSADRMGPAQHGAQRPTHQRLLGGPQGVARVLRGDDDEAREVAAGGLPGRCVERVRRRHQQGAAPFALYLAQRRQNERAFTDARLIAKNLADAAARPTASW